MPICQPPSDAEVLAEFRSLGAERRVMAVQAAPQLLVPASFIQRERAEQFQDFRDFLTSAESVEQQPPFMQEGLSEIIGLVCLTEKPLDRLMWAHYAEPHRGFVAEFAHGEEGQSNGLRVRGSPFGAVAKVRYAASLPELRRDSENVAEVFYTKHQQWRYEEEWRAVESLERANSEQKDDKTFYLLRFKPGHLLRVIFGLRIGHECKERLLTMLSRPEFAHVRTETTRIDGTGALVSFEAAGPATAPP
jgi:hypothetical protein